MGKDKKPIVIVGAVAAAGTVAYLLAKKAKAAPPGEGAASIEIHVYDSLGNLVPHNSPVTLIEGDSYLVTLTVQNTSIKGGVGTGASLGIGINAISQFYTLIASVVGTKAFAAGEVKRFSYALNVPLDPGTTGLITAWVENPSRAHIADAQVQLVITSLAIVYGATIVIGM